jgi:hypothetical protein
LEIAEHVHSWVFTLLQGVTGDHPSGASRNTRAAPTNAVPLVGLSSLQRSRARRSRSFPAVPPAGTLRLQGSSPLDALLPFEPSRRFRRGRSWDSYLQGFAPLEDPGALSSGPEPSCRCSSQSRHASNVLDRTWSSCRGGSDLRLDRVSRLQGFAPFESPYLCASGLEIRRGRCPPGFHPPQGSLHRVRRATVASRPLTRFTPIDSLASLDRRCASASCQTRCRLVSLETAGLPEVPSLYRPVSSRVPAALGY